MKAIVYDQYGPLDVLRYEDIPKPHPGSKQVLMKIHASSVNYGNLALVAGKPFISRFWSGLLKPRHKIPGGDLAGVVEAAGPDVSLVRPGDRVYGDISDCGFGAFAAYAVCPENKLVPMPSNVSFEEAATVPQAALVALQGLRRVGKIREGHKVLIYGASGGNGTFAVQIAKTLGAEVTGVCSGRNTELVRSLGADEVLDYTQEGFGLGHEAYDLILGCSGFRPIREYKEALSPGGIYVSLGGDMKQVNQGLMLGPFLSERKGRKLIPLLHRPSREDLIFISELIQAGKVRPVVDRCFTLDQTAEALRYYRNGRSRGKVVITIQH